MSSKDSPYFWFLVVFTTVLSVLVTYLFLRWVKPMPKGARRGWVGGIFGVAVALQIFAPMVFRNTLDVRTPAITALMWTTYFVMGCLGLILIYSLLWDIGWVTFRTLRAALKSKFVSGRKSPEFGEDRRRWLWKASRLSIASLSLGSATAGLMEARNGPYVKRVNIPVKDLHPSLQGLTIAQISDLHVGPTIAREKVERVVKLTMAEKPGLIALTGDLVDGTVAQLQHDIAPLGDLRAPLGTYFCTGNHEYFAGVLPWLDHYAKLGMQVLGNRHVVRDVKGAKLLIGGVYDSSATRMMPDHRCDPAAAIHGAPAHVDFKLLLAHQPKACDDAIAAGFDLMISGHTHGGQFFPWSLFVGLAQPYNKGLYEHRKGGREMQVYVNAGTSYWGPPVRFGLPSEITLMTLVKA